MTVHLIGSKSCEVNVTLGRKEIVASASDVFKPGERGTLKLRVNFEKGQHGPYSSIKKETLPYPMKRALLFPTKRGLLYLRKGGLLCLKKSGVVFYPQLVGGGGAEHKIVG